MGQDKILTKRQMHNTCTTHERMAKYSLNMHYTRQQSLWIHVVWSMNGEENLSGKVM